MTRPVRLLHQARCACTGCGAHAAALVGRSLVSGICSCCGSQDLVRIGPLESLDTGSLAELGGERLL